MKKLQIRGQKSQTETSFMQRNLRFKITHRQHSDDITVSGRCDGAVVSTVTYS